MMGVVLFQLGLRQHPVTKMHDRPSLVGAIGAFNRAAEVTQCSCQMPLNQCVCTVGAS